MHLEHTHTHRRSLAHSGASPCPAEVLSSLLRTGRTNRYELDIGLEMLEHEELKPRAWGWKVQRFKVCRDGLLDFRKPAPNITLTQAGPIHPESLQHVGAHCNPKYTAADR